eukprot:Pgem_evm1s515
MTLYNSYVLPLKPVDRMVFLYLLITTPALFINADLKHVVWSGVAVRLLFVPLIIYLRHYLVYGHNSSNVDFSAQQKWKFSFNFRQIRFCLHVPVLLTMLLDLYPILLCVYCYGEDGPIIKNLWDRQDDFLDSQIQHFEANLFGFDVNTGLGHAMRSKTSLQFNRIFGEYLHFCYFAFYIVLIGTYLLCWVVCPREHFDRLAMAECAIYLFSLGFYLLAPAAGPYWAYEPPKPEDVGYLFSYITHKAVEGGSSTGTAFPSSHCGITMAVWFCTMLYLPKIAFIYIFICPAIVFATMWCGFHYFVDSFLGVALSCVTTVIAIYVCTHTNYRAPFVDQHNYNVQPDENFDYKLIMSRKDSNALTLQDNEYVDQV